MSRQVSDPQLHAQMAQLCEQMARLIDEGAAREERGWLSRWQPFKQPQAGTSDANGAATLALQCPLGWEWRIGRLVVTAGGASSAAVVVIYVNGTGMVSQQDEQTAEDFEVGFWGSSPSRAVADEMSPIYVPGGQYLVCKVTGAVASQLVTLQMTGERRQL